MKSKNWGRLGFLLMGLMIVLILLDTSQQNDCNNKQINLSESPETIGDFVCIVNAESYDPFIYTIAGFWMISFIMAILTHFDEKRGE